MRRVLGCIAVSLFSFSGVSAQDESDRAPKLRPGYEHPVGRGGKGRDGQDARPDVQPSATVTPEPVTIVLLGSGLVAVGAVALRKRRAKRPLE